ncbi:hypothetical protein [Chitinophaga rhizophila]|uniref:DUF3592 domain-containing protein n=1 Tax=Chitinophaga rhizophila TaxID=2866212 RepID=A0ABS7G6L8_9BACT|nr:hypothetical protein [Chitinophaga rhizophila]MBW8683303.1 hypothetical protein [Chitinophaga rhizophila]
MLLYSFVLIIGIILLALGLADLQRCRRLLRQGNWLVGIVVRLLEDQGADAKHYRPFFEIRTADNQLLTYEGIYGTSMRRWKPGQKAVFEYLPGQYPAVKMLSYWGIFWWPVLLLAIAADLIVVAAGYFLLSGYFQV